MKLWHIRIKKCWRKTEIYIFLYPNFFWKYYEKKSLPRHLIIIAICDLKICTKYFFLSQAVKSLIKKHVQQSSNFLHITQQTEWFCLSLKKRNETLIHIQSTKHTQKVRKKKVSKKFDFVKWTAYIYFDDSIWWLL